MGGTFCDNFGDFSDWLQLISVVIIKISIVISIENINIGIIINIYNIIVNIDIEIIIMW